MTVYNQVEAYRTVTTRIHHAVMDGDNTWNKPELASSAVATFLIGPIADSKFGGAEGDSLDPNLNYAELVCDVRVWMVWFLSNREDLPAVELIRLYGVDGAARVAMGEEPE